VERDTTSKRPSGESRPPALQLPVVGSQQTCPHHLKALGVWQIPRAWTLR
jgi:hypothetical protein